MADKQKLKSLHERMKKWSNDNGDDELDEMLNEYLSALGYFEDGGEDGSNPPGQPGKPPGTGGQG